MNFFFKRLLFAVGGLVAAITMMAVEESDVTRLTFLFKDGTESHFNLADKPEITFDAENLLLNGTDIETTIERGAIDSYYFTQGPYVSITPTEAEKSFDFYYVGSIVRISGSEVKKISLYDVNGICVMEAEAVDGIASVNIESLVPGVYVISAFSGFDAVKIVKH